MRTTLFLTFYELTSIYTCIYLEFFETMKNVLVTKPILRFIFLGANPGETITPIQKKLKQVLKLFCQ